MKRRTRKPKAAPAPQPQIADMKNADVGMPDVPIATFVTNHNAVAHVVATGPRDARVKVVRFTLPNGDTHIATIGAVMVLRELCDSVIRHCGTDIIVPQPAPVKEQS